MMSFQENQDHSLRHDFRYSIASVGYRKRPEAEWTLGAVGGQDGISSLSLGQRLILCSRNFTLLPKLRVLEFSVWEIAPSVGGPRQSTESEFFFSFRFWDF